MKTNYRVGLLLAVLLLMVTVFPVAAAPLGGPPGGPVRQGDGNITFGPYTLSEGESVSGDLVVFGPVLLQSGSSFTGDLVAFGGATIEEDAVLDGGLVATGNLEIAGEVDGNVFCSGDVVVLDTAYISGDISAIGEVTMHEDAQLEGEVRPLENFDNVGDIQGFEGFEDFQELEGATWGLQDLPTPDTFDSSSSYIPRPSRLMQAIGRIGANIMVYFCFGVVAVLITSLWPQQIRRASRVIEERPMPTFGVGLLTLLLAGLLIPLLTVTICLFPVALLLSLVVGVGVLMGLVSLGYVLGERVLIGVFKQPQPTLLISTLAGVGVMLVLSLLTSSFFGPLGVLLTFLIISLAGGAVVLTRFGTRPYATTGAPYVAPPMPPTPPGPPPAPVPPTPPLVVSSEIAPPIESIVEPPAVDPAPDSSSVEYRPPKE